MLQVTTLFSAICQVHVTGNVDAVKGYSTVICADVTTVQPQCLSDSVQVTMDDSTVYTISEFCTEEDVDIISSTSNDFSCHMNWRNLKGEEFRSGIVNRSVKLPKKYVHRYDNDDVRDVAMELGITPVFAGDTVINHL